MTKRIYCDDLLGPAFHSLSELQTKAETMAQELRFDPDCPLQRFGAAYKAVEQAERVGKALLTADAALRNLARMMREE